MGRGRPSNGKSADKKQYSSLENHKCENGSFEESDNQSTAIQETPQNLATKLDDTDTIEHVQKRRRGRPSKASSQNTANNSSIQIHINSALNNTDIISNSNSVNNNKHFDHNATSDIQSSNSSTNLFNNEEETDMELFSSPVETFDCRRSSRKKNIKFDICNLLKGNRRNHKIQIEARIDSNAPKQIDTLITPDENETKQKNFIEKSTIFRRFSNSESNKFSSKILLSSMPNTHDVNNSNCVPLNISIVDSIETNSQMCQQIAENNFSEPKFDSSCLSRTQELINVSLLESQKVESLIQENLENGKTTQQFYNNRKTDNIMNSTKNTASQGSPILPKRRGRKPKNLIVPVAASIDSQKNCKIDENDDSFDGTFMTVGNDGDHSYSIISNNSKSNETLNKIIEKKSNLSSLNSNNCYLLEPTLKTSDKESNCVEQEGSRVKSKSNSPKKEIKHAEKSSNLTSNIDCIYIESDSNSCESLEKTNPSNKRIDVVLSNAKPKIDNKNESSTPKVFNSKFWKSSNSFSPVVLLNKIITFPIKDNKNSYVQIKSSTTSTSTNAKNIGNTVKKINKNINQDLSSEETLINLEDTNKPNPTEKMVELSLLSKADEDKYVTKNIKCLNGLTEEKPEVISENLDSDVSQNKYINKDDNLFLCESEESKQKINNTIENLCEHKSSSNLDDNVLLKVDETCSKDTYDICESKTINSSEENIIIAPIGASNQTNVLLKSNENLKYLPNKDSVSEQINYVATGSNKLLDNKNELINAEDEQHEKYTNEIIDSNVNPELNKTHEIIKCKKINLPNDKFDSNELKQHKTAISFEKKSSSENGLIEKNISVKSKISVKSLKDLMNIVPTDNELLKSEIIGSKPTLHNCSEAMNGFEVITKPKTINSVYFEKTKDQSEVELETSTFQAVDAKESTSKIIYAKQMPVSNTQTKVSYAVADDIYSPKKYQTDSDNIFSDNCTLNIDLTEIPLSKNEEENSKNELVSSAEASLKLIENSQCFEVSPPMDIVDLTNDSNLDENQLEIEKSPQLNMELQEHQTKQVTCPNDLAATCDATVILTPEVFINDEIKIKNISDKPKESPIQIETIVENPIDKPKESPIRIEAIVKNPTIPQSPQIQSNFLLNLETNSESNNISPTKLRKTRWSSVPETNLPEICPQVVNCLDRVDSSNIISIDSNSNTQEECNTVVSSTTHDDLEQNVKSAFSSSILEENAKNPSSSPLNVEIMEIHNGRQSSSSLSVENELIMPEITDAHKEFHLLNYQNSTKEACEKMTSEVLDKNNSSTYLAVPSTSRKSRWNEFLKNYENNVNTTQFEKDKFVENCSTNELELTNCENKIKKALLEIARKLKKEKSHKKLSSSSNELEDSKSKLNKRKKLIFKDFLNSMDLFSNDHGDIMQTKSESSIMKHMKKKNKKLLNASMNECALNKSKHKKKRHEHSKESKRAHKYLNENDIGNGILNSTKTSLSEKALSFLESFQLQNVENQTFGPEQYAYGGQDNRDSAMFSNQQMPALMLTNPRLQRNETISSGEMSTNDPLGDIEKFIEAGESLLSYSRPAAVAHEEDSLNSGKSQSPSKHQYDKSTDNFYEHSKSFEDSNESDSMDSTRVSNKNDNGIDNEIFIDIDDEDVNRKNVRRSHRIKTKSKSSQSIVGRGLVGTVAYSINGHKEDLERIHLRNVNFLKEMEDRLSKFCMIEQNEYKCERIISKEARKMICDCFLTADEEERGEFGCGDDCLNRLLMIECGPECVVGERCTNRRFYNLLYSPCQVFRTEKKGFGIHADNDIMPGEFIMEYVGEVIDGIQFARRRDAYSKEKNKHYYFMALQNDCIIDATARGNISRFINHSCDPNAETQKWTVNGELRIGFFSTKRIKAGDEITFDYQFQRYGKEAQKCYCESSNCRGWIGKEPDSEGEEEDYDENDDESASEDDDIDNEESVDAEYNERDVNDLVEKSKRESDEDYIATLSDEETKNDLLKKSKGRKSASDKENKKGKRKATRKYKRREIWIGKKNDHLEDIDIEDEVQSLLRSGLVNQEHTLRLSRLMVRSKMIETRLKLLEIIRDGDVPCRRLFLDYHGLRLLHGWMNEVIETESSEKNLEIRLALLDTLEVLPITNKNRLIDSKVYQTVQNWANKVVLLNSNSGSPNEELPNDSESAPQIQTIEDNIKSGYIETVNVNVSPEDQIIDEIQKLAEKLIIAWDVLPENFKIPKRERIEQMKEHEREADQQYMSLTLLDEENNSFNKSRYIKSRSLSDSKYKWSSEKGERSHRRHDSDRLKDTSLSKVQRRELFAAKVVRDEVEKRVADQRREFEVKCRFFGYDPKTITLKDMPFCVNSGTGQWYAVDRKEIPTPPSHTHMVIPEKPKSVKPEDYELPEIDLPPLWKYAIDERGRIYYYHSKIRIPQWLPPGKEEEIINDDESSSQEQTISENNEPTDSEKDSDDSMSCREEELQKLLEEQGHADYIANKLISLQEKRYNMMVQERPISPRREEDRLYSKIELRKYKDNKEKIRKRKEEMRRRVKLAQADKTLENSSTDVKASDTNDGTVPIHAYLYSSDEEVNIKVECNSPLIDSIIQCDKIVDEIDAIKKRKYLKRQLIMEDYNMKKYVKLEKKIKLENDNDDSGSGSGRTNSNSSNKSSIKNKSKELDGSKYRKAREKFRIEIAAIIVQHLSRYCKDTCTTGRITSTEDFKHLARKLTHFILLKELKYCHSVGQELIVTESVKNKSKAFIKKYMTKYGTTYVRPSTDPEFKEISFNN